MNLHELNPKHPYAHLDVLTTYKFEELRDREHAGWEADDDYPDQPSWINGTIRDLWLEDTRAFGVWQCNEDHNEYVVRLPQWDTSMRWAVGRDNLVKYRGQITTDRGYWAWEMYDDNTLSARTPYEAVDLLEK